MLVASSLAYVAPIHEHRDGPNPVYVLKVATGEVLDSVEVGALAGEIAIHPAGNRVYVVENPQQPDEASIIETASNTVTGSVTVGTTPIYAAISPDGSHVYVGNVGAQTVSVIETTTDTEVTAVDVNGLPRGLAVTPDGGSVYVTLGDDCPGTVEVIDTGTNTAAGSIALAECAGGDIAINPAGAFAYVPDGRFTSVTVIDTGDNTVETTIEGLFAPRDVAISADGSLAYVTEFTTGGDLVVVDATSHEIMDKIDLGSTRTPSTVALSPDGVFATSRLPTPTKSWWSPRSPIRWSTRCRSAPIPSTWPSPHHDRWRAGGPSALTGDGAPGPSRRRAATGQDLKPLPGASVGLIVSLFSRAPSG